MDGKNFEREVKLTLFSEATPFRGTGVAAGLLPLMGKDPVRLRGKIRRSASLDPLR